MHNFLVNFDKELIDFGIINIDQSFFNYISDSADVTLINSDGVSKVFKIDRKEKALSGTGLKTFFKKYDSSFTSVEEQNTNVFKLTSQAINGNKKAAEFDSRTNMILSGILQPSHIQDDWFELYEYAKGFFGVSSDNELNCLSALTKIEKFKYQINTVKKIVSQFRGRVLLCDEVGLGKTIEACMAATEYIMRGLVKKILILAPAPLVNQWYGETSNLFNLGFVRADDNEIKKDGVEIWSKHDKIIASIASAKRSPNREAVLNEYYDLVIVDEAHHLKNAKTVSWNFVNSINKKYIFLLTATPVQNNLEELFNLITLLKPGQLSTYSYFKQNFVADKSGLTVKNSKKLKGLLESVMIRNRRAMADVKLPLRYASTYRLDFSAEEKNLYDDISGFVKERLNKLNAENTPANSKDKISRFALRSIQEHMGSSFHALLETLGGLGESLPKNSEENKLIKSFRDRTLKISGSPHNEKLMKTISVIREFEKAENSSGKVIIFTKYIKTQEKIYEFLTQNGIKSEVFNGSIPKREKEKRIERFRNESQVLISTGAGGEGHNLQFCNVMINFDLPWNPMDIEQRIGRIHRIGQERDVYVFSLSNNGTIEDYILDILDRKINMFEIAIGETDMILGDTDEQEDFGELAFSAWAKSESEEETKQFMEEIGDKLAENKKHYEQIKKIDEKLFADLGDLNDFGDSGNSERKEF
jgi:SNF2 family DNA or RNA helicase